MKIEGGCYCKALRFTAEGDSLFQGQCHCRECQYASGGNPNVVMAMPEAGFTWTSGSPKGSNSSHQKISFHGPSWKPWDRP